MQAPVITAHAIVIEVEPVLAVFPGSKANKGKGVSYHAMTSRQCRDFVWFEHGSDPQDWRVCGEPVVGDGSYCKAHRKIYYVPARHRTQEEMAAKDARQHWIVKQKTVEGVK